MFNERDQSGVPPHKPQHRHGVSKLCASGAHGCPEQRGYGLKMRLVSEEENNQRVARALETVADVAYAERMPNQLSGGEQQRVAARPRPGHRPDVILLDEPLSHLDAKASDRYARQIKDIHRKIARTMIYVTHDQAEALSMADRIAVMRRGRIVQVGTPRQLYTRGGIGLCG